VTANRLAGDLLANLPELHHWRGKRQVGGLDRRIGNRIVSEMEAHPSAAILETGAGASTLLFLCLAPSSLTSIAPSQELGDRIVLEAQARSIPSSALRYIADRSELALPVLARDDEQLDVALIDGSHSWPTVFVDFCYINMMLRRGGLLFLDDVQLHSVGQLFLLLRQQPEFEYLGLERKFATFRKVSDEPFLPEWGGQPFIVANSFNPA
jgi:methyltransferase family protein